MTTTDVPATNGRCHSRMEGDHVLKAAVEDAGGAGS